MPIPIKVEWIIEIQRQYDEQNVEFFFKQYWADGVERSKNANGGFIRSRME